jgi:hypothetical protein
MSSKIVHYNGYVAGWLDSSIQDFLELLPRSYRSMEFALITCLDSNREPASLLDKSTELGELAKDARVSGTGVLVPTRTVVEANSRHRLFFGFDEIWLFPHDQIDPKPASASLVGPARIDQAKIEDLGQWMSKNSCALGLGDGEGLNFVVKARGLLKPLLGCSLEQPHVPTAFAAGPV